MTGHTGRHMLLTGSNGGIGFASVYALAWLGLRCDDHRPDAARDEAAVAMSAIPSGSLMRPWSLDMCLSYQTTHPLLNIYSTNLIIKACD